MWLVLLKQNACRPCKLDHAISFNPTIRFGNWHTVATVRIWRSFFMICNEWINACNAIVNFGYMNGHCSHFPWLNYGCKIECLQFCWIIFFFYHIWYCIFMFFVFLEERDIKVEQNYIFNQVYNKYGLRKSNWANLRWVKCQISNYM